MKKSILLVISVGLLFLLSMPAAASTSTPWKITDGNATTLTVGTLGDLEFGIWDLAQPDSRLKLIDNTTTGLYAAMKYDALLNVNVLAGESAGKTLATGGSGIFGFYFSNDGGSTFLDYVYENPGGGDQYLFTIPSISAPLTIESDVTVVPIPPSALLLGCGLIGLVGLKWRRRETLA